MTGERPAATGYVIATRLTGDDVWSIRTDQDRKPTAAEMARYRAIYRPRGYEVHAFSEPDWDALPVGQQSGDWVVVFNERIPRYKDEGGRWPPPPPLANELEGVGE